MKLFRLALVTFVVLRVGAQVPMPASIAGTVVRWGTTDPVAQAIVELRNPTDTRGVPLLSTATRQNGEYVFTQVPPGRYRIIVTRKGFAPGEYGQRRPSGIGTPVTLAPGQTLANARIEMAAGASVSGRVYYANGDPMPIARVQISKLTFRNGTPELTLNNRRTPMTLGNIDFSGFLPGRTT